MSISTSESADRARLIQKIERAVALNEEDPTEGDLAAFARTVSDWITHNWDDDGAKSLSYHLGIVWSDG